MENSELLSLLVELGNVAELNRLLSAFSRQTTRRIGPTELVELANNSAGADYRYPNPQAALNVAFRIGLLRRVGKTVSLTRVGRMFLQSRDRKALDPSLKQDIMLLGLFLDDPHFAEVSSELFRQFGRGSVDRLESKTPPSSWTNPMQHAAMVFQQLGVMRELDGALIVDPIYEPFVVELVVKASIDEETLWRRLEAQRIRARDAEEFVKREEQRRLAQAGRKDLSLLVVRVSAHDVSAGYDIRSFNVDDSPRYIEVKSSIGTLIRFDWSVMERNFADKNGDSYWIYFVPLAASLENRTMPIWMLADPVGLIRSGVLGETPSRYAVSEVGPGVRRTNVTNNRAEPLAKWPP
jgi:Protein NO VEIN, C-terminal